MRKREKEEGRRTDEGIKKEEGRDQEGGIRRKEGEGRNRVSGLRKKGEGRREKGEGRRENGKERKRGKVEKQRQKEKRTRGKEMRMREENSDCEVQVTHGSWYHRPRLFHCASRRWTKARKPWFQMSPSSWIGSRRSWPSCIPETREPSCLNIPAHQFLIKNVVLCQSRNFGTNIDPQRMQVARAVAHGPERPTLRENRWSAR